MCTEYYIISKAQPVIVFSLHSEFINGYSAQGLTYERAFQLAHESDPLFAKINHCLISVHYSVGA